MGLSVAIGAIRARLNRYNQTSGQTSHAAHSLHAAMIERERLLFRYGKYLCFTQMVLYMNNQGCSNNRALQSKGTKQDDQGFPLRGDNGAQSRGNRAHDFDPCNRVRNNQTSITFS